MKTISIKQPWASLIVHGVKDIENRTWKCPEKYIGQRVLIHASSRMPIFKDSEMSETTEDFLKLATKDFNDWSKFPTGAIIGSVKIEACVRNHPSKWAIGGVYNWVLSEPFLFHTPFLGVKGKLCFWEFDKLKEVNIKCPECGDIQPAIVDYSTYPFNTYFHKCRKCGELILESEWDEIK